MAATVIAVYSTKGGVGKTTTAVNLAWQAASEGRDVLLWDLDPQAAATWLLQVKPASARWCRVAGAGKKPVHKAVRESNLDRIDVLPADKSYRDLDITLDAAKKSSSRVTDALKPLRKEYDVIILDTPPGASLVAENALRAADVVVLPLIPSPLGLRSLEQVKGMISDAGGHVKLVAFLSQVDRRKRAHREALEQLPSAHKEIGKEFVGASVVVERMGEHRAPVGAFAPTSESARAFSSLWKRVRRAA